MTGAISKPMPSVVGRLQARNPRKKQKAVFLNRRGTVSRSASFLRGIRDFRLPPEAAAGIRRLNLTSKAAGAGRLFLVPVISDRILQRRTY